MQNKMIKKIRQDIKTIQSCITCLSTKNLASTEQIREELTQAQFTEKNKLHFIWK